MAWFLCSNLSEDLDKIENWIQLVNFIESLFANSYWILYLNLMQVLPERFHGKAENSVSMSQLWWKLT